MPGFKNEKVSSIGQPLYRLDSHEKITGRAIYTIDHILPNMLFGKITRSSIPHGKILSVNVEKARKIRGVRCIITGFDIPYGLHGMGLNDTPTLARDVVRYVGEPIAAVAADTPEVAEEAAELIEVDYERLDSVFNPEDAMNPSKNILLHPKIHEYKKSIPPPPRNIPNVSSMMKIRHGDITSAMQKSHTIIENQFTTQMVHTLHMEPNCCIAKAEPDGSLTVWSSSQAPYRTRQELSDALLIPPSQIRVITPYVGGGFGNKLTISVEAVCSLLAIRTNRPVKMVLSREEVFSATTVRHSYTIRIKDGVDRDGKIRARQIRAVLDGGAYSGGGGVRVGITSCFATLATYAIPSLWIDTLRVYTNKPPGGAFRGFGSAQMDWAIESQMDIVARELGLDPVEFRLRNLAEDGQTNAVGERLKGVDNKKCLSDAAHAYRAARTSVAEPWSFGRGIAIADKYCAGPSGSVALIRLRENRKAEVLVTATEIGVGVKTILAQIVADMLGISYKDVRVLMSDTGVTPYDAGAYSSRQTYHVGNAVRNAVLDAKGQVLEKASKILDKRIEDLEFNSWEVSTRSDPTQTLRFEDLFAQGKGGFFLDEGGEFLGKASFFQAVGRLDPDTGRCATDRAAAFYTPAAIVADLMVNHETGQVKLLKLNVTLDVGRAINPKLVEGMMEGSSYMGASTTLFEEMILESGRITNADLLHYKTLGVMEAPRISCSILESPHPDGPFGARGAGEAAITCIAPAIGNAIYDAIGVRFYDLPITAEKILLALQKRYTSSVSSNS